MSEPLVIVGNGMAAMRLVEELRQRALGRYAIAVIGEEPRPAYNRVLLSAVLAQEVSSDEIQLKPVQWWRDSGVTLLFGQRVTEIDNTAGRVRLANGIKLPFSKLVLATGSRPIRLNVPGMDLAGVLTFRDLSDVGSIERLAVPGKKAVVIGGGLLGLEAAYGMAKAGLQVTILHLMDRLMERQLDPRAASMLKQAIEAKGMKVLLNAETIGIDGTNHAEAACLKDGRRLQADLVVVAAGVRPNVELGYTIGLDINRGIVVDDQLRSSRPNVFAIGECAEHRGICYGLVEPAYDQAQVLASHLAGESTSYPGSILATNLKVSGVNVFSAGDFVGGPGTEQIIFVDAGLGVYKKLIIADGKLTGAVLFGDTTDGLWYLEHIRSGNSIEPFRKDIIFGRALVESLPGSHAVGKAA